MKFGNDLNGLRSFFFVRTVEKTSQNKFLLWTVISASIFSPFVFILTPKKISLFSIENHCAYRMIILEKMTIQTCFKACKMIFHVNSYAQKALRENGIEKKRQVKDWWFLLKSGSRAYWRGWSNNEDRITFKISYRGNNSRKQRHLLSVSIAVSCPFRIDKLITK